MRILHFADLHLGIERYGRPDPATGFNTRFLDFLRVLDETVQAAVDLGVDIALFCGDAYKNQRPDPTEQREFALRLARLSAHNITTFLLVGNHDQPGALKRATTMDIFDALAVRNIIVASQPGIYRLPTREGILQVVALPWLRRTALLSRDEDRELSLEEMDLRVREILTNVIRALAQELDPEHPAILAAHVGLDTARPGVERSLMLGRDAFILQSSLTGLPFRYIALGHVHRHQVLNEDPPIVYSGSLERVDFSEAEDEKGFYVVDMEPSGKVKFEFHRVAARPFVTISVDVLPEQKPEEAVLKAVSRCRDKIKDAVVRLEITSSKPVRLEGKEVRRALEEAFYVAPPVIHTVKESRVRLAVEDARSLTPLEALRLYFRQKSIPPSREEKLLQYARRLIAEIEEQEA